MPLTDIKDPSKLADDLLSIEEMAEEEGLSKQEIEDLKDIARTDTIKRENALSTLGLDLEAKFKKYASNRSDKEQEWVSVLLQYNRQSTQPKEKGKMPSRGSDRTKPGVNITRARTNLAIERLQDIQFPLGGDYNFHIDSLHDPDVEKNVNNDTPLNQVGSDLPEALQPGMLPPPQGQQGVAPSPDGQAPTVGQQAQAILNRDKERAYKMETKIKDQLSATKYGKRARASMRDWAILGTAITKGPVLERKRQKFYNHIEDSQGGLQSEVQFEVIDMPAVHVVDPRFFYPDSSLNAEDMEDAFELHPLTKKQMIELSHDKSYMAGRIREVLALEPDGNKIESSLGLLHGTDTDADFSNKYLVKEYHGPIDKEILLTLGEITEEEKEDDLQMFYGTVWISQGVVLRVSLSMIDGDDSHPYHIAVWEQDDGSLFGHGMPYMMADQQRVVEATWQMLLDNAGLSAGPQIVLNREAIEPANGKWDMESMKLWYMTEYGTNVQDAFQFVNIPNNQQSLMNVIESAMQFADIESQSPMIQAHTEPQANVPAMNMGMVLTEANVHQRELSQHWDDHITIPLINRFVHYNIQYSDSPDIKGNFQATVGGATERIDNQILAQDIERILSMASQDPSYQVQIKSDEAFRRWVAATRAGPDLLRSAEEVEVEQQRLEQEAQNAPPDPEMIRAQAVAAREEARQAELQAEMQMKQQEMQMKQQQQQLELQLKQMEMQLRRAELLARAQEKEIELQIALIESGQKQEIDMAKIVKDLNIEESRQELQRYLKAIELEKFNAELRVKQQTGTGI